jgi:hypothetical protein
MKYKCITRLRKNLFWVFEQGNIIEQDVYDRLNKDQQAHFEPTDTSGDFVIDWNNRIKDDAKNN